MTIKLHDLRPAPGAKTRKTRVGRGLSLEWAARVG